jgi:hypothetical protein
MTTPQPCEVCGVAFGALMKVAAEAGLREKLIKIGANVVRHARRVIFHMAEVAASRELFRAILEGIGRLRLPTPLPD